MPNQMAGFQRMRQNRLNRYARRVALVGLSCLSLFVQMSFAENSEAEDHKLSEAMCDKEASLWRGLNQDVSGVLQKNGLSPSEAELEIPYEGERSDRYYNCSYLGWYVSGHRYSESSSWIEDVKKLMAVVRDQRIEKPIRSCSQLRVDQIIIGRNRADLAILPELSEGQHQALVELGLDLRQNPYNSSFYEYSPFSDNVQAEFVDTYCGQVSVLLSMAYRRYNGPMGVSFEPVIAQGKLLFSQKISDRRIRTLGHLYLAEAYETKWTLGTAKKNTDIYPDTEGDDLVREFWPGAPEGKSGALKHYSELTKCGRPFSGFAKRQIHKIKSGQAGSLYYFSQGGC